MKPELKFHYIIIEIYHIKFNYIIHIIIIEIYWHSVDIIKNSSCDLTHWVSTGLIPNWLAQPNPTCSNRLSQF